MEVPGDCHTDAAQMRALSAANLPGWPVDIKRIRYLLNACNMLLVNDVLSGIQVCRALVVPVTCG